MNPFLDLAAKSSWRTSSVPAGKAASSPVLLSGPLPASGFPYSCSDFDSPQDELPTSQGSWEGGLNSVLKISAFSSGMQRPRGQSGIINSYQAPNPAQCLHSASSSVWENRFNTRLLLARCYWKQFSYPAGPEGEYYNRGRHRRPIHHHVVSLRDNKLYSHLPWGPGGCQLLY